MSEWQPIETAPKDGTPIDLFRVPPSDGKWACRVTAMWDVLEDEWVWPDGATCWPYVSDDLDWLERGDIYSSDGRDFTHWMPLPPPPAEAQS